MCLKGRYWSQEEIDYLKNNYRKIPNEEIAEHLERTLRSLENKIKRAFGTMGRQKKNWTSIEDEILLENYDFMDTEELANKLHRSAESLRIRIGRLRGSREKEIVDEQYLSYEVADFMGVASATVNRWCREGLIENELISKRRLIHSNIFWSWLSNNLDKVNFKNINDDILYSVPEWYSELVIQKKRETYSNDLLKKHKTPYSPIENALMWDMFLKGYNRTQIANELDRTYSSVKHQLLKLKKQRMKRAA